MSAQAAISAKTALTALSLTGTALSVAPRGRDQKGNLLWVSPGATTLDDISVDMSFRTPTKERKSTKSLLRVFVPKTATNSTTGLVEFVGNNIANFDVTLLENATAAEKQKVLDILTSVICSAEFRTAWTTGDVMY